MKTLGRTQADGAIVELTQEEYSALHRLSQAVRGGIWLGIESITPEVDLSGTLDAIFVMSQTLQNINEIKGLIKQAETLLGRTPDKVTK